MTSEVSQMPGDNLGSDEAEFSFLDLLQVMVDHSRLLVFIPLAVGLVALGISFLITPTFTATTRILPPQQQSSAMAMLQNLGGALGGLASAATGIKNPNDQYIALLRSNTVADRLTERYQLVERYELELKQDARKVLSALTAISAGKDGLITIDFSDESPEFAAEIANAYVEELSRLLNHLAVTEAQQRRAFFEDQLLQTKNKLAEAELALTSSGVNPSALKSNPAAAVQSVAELQAQIVASEVRISTMRGYLAPTAPEVKVAQAELAALRSQLAQLERSDAVKPGTPADADYIVRYRNFKYFETLFELFAKQFELAKVDEAREGALVQVVDRAIPPERKSRPRKALIAVVTTLVTGMLLLTTVIIGRLLRNASVHPATAQRMEDLRASWRRAWRRT